jgi:MYXO-CTERM domain-containing protein
MQHTRTLACAAALALASLAHADFTGWSATTFLLPSGHMAMNVFANFSHEGDRLLNVFNGSVTTSAVGGFHQSAANPFWQPDNQNMFTADDSFVCVDVNASGNAVAASSVGDPNFANFTDANGATNFSIIHSIAGGAGWYNPNPASPFGLADGFKVLVAHFVAAGTPENPPSGLVAWNMMVNFNRPNGQTIINQGAGLHFFEWSPANTPAPGALGVLAAGALARRRRRRI